MIEELIAGDTLDFLDTVAEYPPADGWTLKYRLVPRFTSPVQAPIDITASTSGAQYRVQAAAGITVNWSAGAYTWSRWVEKAGPIRQSLGNGQLEVIENPATATAGYDGRTHERKMLEAIEACLESRATTTQREMVAYAIGSRSQTFDAEDTRAELVKLRNTYAWMVSDQEGLAAGINRRRINTRIQRA